MINSCCLASASCAAEGHSSEVWGTGHHLCSVFRMSRRNSRLSANAAAREKLTWNILHKANCYLIWLISKCLPKLHRVQLHLNRCHTAFHPWAQSPAKPRMEAPWMGFKASVTTGGDFGGEKCRLTHRAGRQSHGMPPFPRCV